ncbi:hypothetical protein HYH02_002762 [Chlamydomonas schloesseri]|uniref:SET domain-containing protein n=1 Tax=Chlamydomonas schloesseri TaxID=2026947 RepID=A0A835WSD2_9CHLO|nr:hypothetical protein HYH02_002762 [Chlamydomonas schloesseri]|eukprot:KAG2452524.1 hypothetical protein HYH02_002762 [Chlamydomonas schloesseri]
MLGSCRSLQTRRHGHAGPRDGHAARPRVAVSAIDSGRGGRGVGGSRGRGGGSLGSRGSSSWGGGGDSGQGSESSYREGPSGRRDGTMGARGGRSSFRGGRGGRGRGGGGRGRGLRGGSSSRRWGDEDSDSEDDSDDDDYGDDGIDDGFVVIGKVDSATLAARQALIQSGAAAAAAAGSAPGSAADLKAAAGAGTGAAAGGAAADPLDGSRFWAEVSGIEDIDEEDDEGEDGEGEGAGGAADDEDDDQPQTPEQLLENMHSLGFTLQPTEAEQAAAAAAAAATAAAGAANAAADASSTGDAAAASSATGAVKTGADAVLRDLRDTYIATMKSPTLPPWFLGPVEAAAVAPRAPQPPKPPRGGSSASSSNSSAPSAQEPVATGRGFTLRTTRAVVPGELLAVSLPLAVCYCDRGTTPENEELADLMLGTPGAAVAAGRIAAAVADAKDEDNEFVGLTDLQQSLLGMLWQGHGAAAGSGGGGGAGSTGGSASGGGSSSADTAAAAAPAAPAAPGGKGKASRGGGGSGGGPVKRAFLELVAKSAADGGAARSLPLVSGPEEMYGLVNVNCIGEDFQDLALCELRGEVPRGHIGLWPEAALAAHSCAPTATAYSIGNRLLIRAAADIPKGGEVSLNFLGSLLTSPLEVRRAELRSQYGFTCGCSRCAAEARHAGTPLAALLHRTYAACQELAPELDAAIAAGDSAAVEDAKERLVRMQADLEAAMRSAEPKVNAKVRRWMQASVYDLYDLISLCADELAVATALEAMRALLGNDDQDRARGRGGGDEEDDDDDEDDEDDSRGRRRQQRPPQRGGGGKSRSAAWAAASAPVVETEALVQCCRIVEGVTPGSDAHVYLAAELVMRSLERFGPQHEEYRQARASLVRAYGVRYGNVGPAVMEQLVAARLAAEAAAEAAEAEEAAAAAGAM